ncbi:hypothetical protein ACFCV9_03040 [Streptomyces sp. NPDC056367]|uniref:hypothetical protein n=1 Tax=Streptomyces sp. NPDC056367 TaxID=3345797 RepID=UPI0035E34DFB
MVRHKNQVYAKHVNENRTSAARFTWIELKINVHCGRYGHYVRPGSEHSDVEDITMLAADHPRVTAEKVWSCPPGRSCRRRPKRAGL